MRENTGREGLEARGEGRGVRTGGEGTKTTPRQSLSDASSISKLGCPAGARSAVLAALRHASWLAQTVQLPTRERSGVYRHGTGLKFMLVVSRCSGTAPTSSAAMSDRSRRSLSAVTPG